MGLDHRNNPSCLCLVPFNSSQRQGNDSAGRGPGALMCYFISGFELQDPTGFLDVVSLTPGGFSRGLCCRESSAFHLTAAQLNPRDAELIVGRRREPGRDSSNTKTRGKCRSYLRSVSVTLHFPRSSNDKAALAR